jgi:hypothetical protein
VPLTIYFAHFLTQRNEIDDAVELFFEVLQARIELHGGKAAIHGAVIRPDSGTPFSFSANLVTAPSGTPGRFSEPPGCASARSLRSLLDLGLECASAYFKYGSCLFYKAQDEADFLGAPMQDAAKQRDGAMAGYVCMLPLLGTRFC